MKLIITEYAMCNEECDILYKFEGSKKEAEQFINDFKIRHKGRFERYSILTLEEFFNDIEKELV